MGFNFSEWIDSSLISELSNWFSQFQRQILSSIKPSSGFISLSISSLFNKGSILRSNAISGDAMSAESLSSLGSFGGILEGLPGWKGVAALNAADGMELGWGAGDRKRFSSKMSGGSYSIPQVVGKELGLLFEVEIFLYLVKGYKLKVIGERGVKWCLGEQSRLVGIINKKLGERTGGLAIDFIRGHAYGNNGMGQLIMQKGLGLLRCGVDCIEFTGGEGYVGGDTADIRLGCSEYMVGERSSLGFSLKAVTETRIEIRTLGPMKLLLKIGANFTERREIRDIMRNPLYEAQERRESLLYTINKICNRTYKDQPRRFASLLDDLLSGGGDTLPAYRNLLGASGVGFSDLASRDFVTKEGPGAKLGAKSGAKIDVSVNKTYVKITYMVSGGNFYGTSVQFEPNGDGSKISVSVNNLTPRS